MIHIAVPLMNVRAVRANEMQTNKETITSVATFLVSTITIKVDNNLEQFVVLTGNGFANFHSLKMCANVLLVGFPPFLH